jgi:hypothetical protein
MDVHRDVLNVRRLHLDVHHASVCHLAVDHDSPFSSRLEHAGLDVDLSSSVVVSRRSRCSGVAINDFKVRACVGASLTFVVGVIASEHATHEERLSASPVNCELKLHIVVVVDAHGLTSFKVANGVRVFAVNLRKN